MTRLSRRLLWSLAAAAVLVAACVVALVDLWPHAPPGVAPRLVPAAWAQFSTSAGHRSHVGRGKAECRDCHAFEREGFKNPGTAVCRKCHDKELSRSHHGEPGSRVTDCLSCHMFAPGKVAPSCIGCHDRRQGNAPAIVQHATADCASCHESHEDPAVVAAACAGCHKELALEHGRHAGTRGCLDCHRAHEPAAAAVASCASCHAQARAPHPPAHDACTGCHEPHTFLASEGKCIGCHGAKSTLVDRLVPAHRVCLDCHAPHAPAASAAAACTRCHGEIRVSHGSAGACTGCHRPHGDDPVAVAVACTTCHGQVASTDRSAHAGGLLCASCHKAHAFAARGEGTLCQGCHERQTTLVATNPGHADCLSCHGASAAHRPVTPPVACGSCHAAEQSSAPPGHQRCVGCHEPHAGKQTPTCGSCHAKETRGPHAAIAGGCATCHVPHGPGRAAAALACKTCHAAASLPALHAAPGHAVACSSCHASPHEMPQANRAACTGSCHTDKRAHQPDASSCTGCHVFRT